LDFLVDRLKNLCSNADINSKETLRSFEMRYDDENLMRDDSEFDVFGLHSREAELDDFADDGQPDEYTEWQDVYGGDDWDHGQYDDF
jgi:hypothetical protein